MITLILVLGMLGMSLFSIPFGAESRPGFDERSPIS